MVFTESIENSAGIATVFVEILRPNDDVVQVDVTDSADVQAEG